MTNKQIINMVNEVSNRVIEREDEKNVFRLGLNTPNDVIRYANHYGWFEEIERYYTGQISFLMVPLDGKETIHKMITEKVIEGLSQRESVNCN